MVDDNTPVYLVEIGAHNGTDVLTLRYATSGVVVDGYYYEPRLINPGSIRSMLFGEGTTFGSSSTGYGEIVLVNSDGALDALIGYGLSGRTVMIKRLLAGVVTILAACTGEQATVTTEQVALRIKDPSAVFNVPVQTNKYGGTNALPAGVDGTDDIKGKEKPLVYGTVYNVAPVLVNTSKLIFQFSDGAVQSIPAMYDKGVKLVQGNTYNSQADMEANAPNAGEYRAWLEGGMGRLGSSPAGQITGDVVEGATAADRTAAQIAKRIALRKITTVDLIAQDFSDLDALNGADVGIYINGNTTVRAALDEVLGSIGGWWAFDGNGKLNVGRLDAPTGTPTITLANAEILSLDRVATNDEGRGVPAYQVALNYAKNWTVQDINSLAGSVPDDDKSAWTPSTFPVSALWYDVAYGAGRYVAITIGYGANSAAVSSDGKAWRMISTPTYGTWDGVQYCNGKFILVAKAQGKVAVSSDLTTWVEGTLPSMNNWEGITYGNGVYVAMGTGKCATSTDLVTWTSRTVPSAQWSAAAFENGMFVSVAIDSQYIIKSTNGAAWASVVSNLYTDSILSTSGIFVTFVEGPIASVYYSTDAVNWLEATLPISSKQWAGTTANGTFILFSHTGGVNRILASSDGATWFLSDGPTDREYWKIAVGSTTAFLFTVNDQYYTSSSLVMSTPRSQFIAYEYRRTTATDSSVLTTHLNSPTINFTSLITGAGAAQSEATRLLNLYKVRRDYIIVTCPLSSLPSQLPAQGKTVKLTYPRFGYGSGKLFTFLGYEQHLDSDEVMLYLWG